MHSNGLLVVGDCGARTTDKVYADIMIGHVDYYSELTKNPPNLSKGLGWEVKNDLADGSKVSEGKDQLVKYTLRRIHL